MAELKAPIPLLPAFVSSLAAMMGWWVDWDREGSLALERSTVLMRYTLSLSKGAVAVRETAPARPPASR